ncbi:HAMP domain-containing sensor histidine kinase [Streptomyces calidiresistens]|uniref:histidine kinase n=1 Tax=Streptomyces calidiresistens TaxID=1485586 RepID=A0A7W3XVN8_9ACTN|nr:ATP-binding protein [Streptomyces calidiresistens]MBB0228907.1 HAMP domain-containing protein [Streptomyces calidiresistens]
MRSRLLALLITLLAGVLLALGIPLAAGQAAAEQQRVVVDRIDDTVRFASLAQYAVGSGEDDPGVDPLAQLQDELERYHDLYGIRAGVLNRDGTPLAAAPAGWALPGGDRARSAFAEALAGRRSQGPPQVWPWDTGTRLLVASPVVRDGDVIAVVVTDSPTGALRARILRGWLPIAAAEAAAMLLAVAAAIRLTGWVLRPVRVLDRAAHQIATGRMNARVAEAGGPPELRRLARSFNEMADHVEQVLEQQRAFVADASHQLRNPLAALLLRIELLGLALPPGSEEFASVQAEGKRLARVLDDLLDLALAEHSEADLRLTDVAALVGERVDAWRPLAERRGLTLERPGPGALTALADPVALSSALDALIDNALKFTPPGGTVTIRTSAAGGRVRIEVLDTGPGLQDDELERIGDRFWRSGRHQNVSGSGLGLSIVRALLAAGHGTIDFTHHRPHGLRVVVSLPRTREDIADGGPGAGYPDAGYPVDAGGPGASRPDQSLADR